MDHPYRKSLRLENYDYSQNGAYFVTVCTANRRKILSQVVGAGFHAGPIVELSEIGIEIEKTIKYYNTRYDQVFDKYVIMPNHLHCIIIYEKGGHGNPPLPDLVGQLKSYTTLRFNVMNSTTRLSLWQRSYYEHIIRNETDYLNIWQYLDDNPAKWIDDEYYN